MNVKPARILMIDDEQLVLEVLTAYLEDSGFEVTQAIDGQTGIELARREQFDLVLCDLRMPGIDGLHVLATITCEFPELPILVVSGMGGMSDAIQALKLGAWDYVTKPIEDMADRGYGNFGTRHRSCIGAGPAATGKPRTSRTPRSRQ